MSVPAEEKLRARLRELSAGGIALAYSGGADSALLLHLLAELRREKPFPLLALTMRSAFSPQSPDACGVPQEFVDLDVFREIPALRKNPRERCYLCKRRVFERFAEIARSRGLAVLADGTNADDLGEFRPGLRALRECGVVSPLAEAGIGKKQVRALAGALGLACAKKASAPCLATRFPYGASLTDAGLRAVASAEDFLREIVPASVSLRLRVHGEIARIEIPPENFAPLVAARERICTRLRELGFRFVVLDLAGFRSGSMD